MFLWIQFILYLVCIISHKHLSILRFPLSVYLFLLAVYFLKKLRHLSWSISYRESGFCLFGLVCLLDSTYKRNQMVQYLSFSVWLTSLSVHGWTLRVLHWIFLNLLNRSSEGEQVKQMLKNGAEISDVWNHIAYNSDIYA